MTSGMDLVLGKQPELRKCWYRPTVDKDRVGLFHQWGIEAGCKEGDGLILIGIVEDCETHAIVKVDPERIKFLSEPGP